MGPCLCGDPYCPSCGNPELAKLKAAEEELINNLAGYFLSVEEYKLFFDVGLAAVKAARLVTYANSLDDDSWSSAYDFEKNEKYGLDL